MKKASCFYCLTSQVAAKKNNRFALLDLLVRSAVVEVLQILSKIRCNDSIMAVAAKYRLEEVVYSLQLLNQEAV